MTKITESAETFIEAFHLLTPEQQFDIRDKMRLAGVSAAIEILEKMREEILNERRTNV